MSSSNGNDNPPPGSAAAAAAATAGKRRRRLDNGDVTMVVATAAAAANGGGTGTTAPPPPPLAYDSPSTAVPQPSRLPEYVVPDGCVHGPSYLRSVRASFRVPGLQVIDHFFQVPLDHWAAAATAAATAGATTPTSTPMIEIFARELCLPPLGPRSGRDFLPVPSTPTGEPADPSATADAAANAAAMAADVQPPPPHTQYLLYLQGGPGFESPRPTDAGGWVKAAISQGFRVLLLDQRGTGRSTPVTLRALAAVGSGESDDDPENAQARSQAEYLRHFRADSIVRDAELVRLAFSPSGALRWTLLGQSFGGFCATTYLSLPHGAHRSLNEVLLTGGLPPRVHSPNCADEVYRRLYKRVMLQNDKYYARFPADEELVRRCVLALAAHEGGKGFLMPSGTRLSPRAFQLLGLSGLGSGGGFDRLHYLLESFFEEGGVGEGGGEANGGATTATTAKPTTGPSAAFCKAFESWMPWDVNPLYILLHEPIYCQRLPPQASSRRANADADDASSPPSSTAPNWAAERVRREKPFSDAFDAVARATRGDRVYFTGEMVFPWMLEDFSALRPFQRAAHLLATDAELWSRSPSLYDPQRLAANLVPVAAASYVEDMYVDYDLASETASSLKSCRVWATSEYRHSGIRDDGARILERLLAMARGASLLE
jgi:pimeloyl-ACP methyl ester carboxylesterase